MPASSSPLRDGGGLGQRGRGPGGLSGDCGAHQCGLWGFLPGPVSPAVYAQFLRQRISVVNIDNGFGAGYLASMINHMEAKR